MFLPDEDTLLKMDEFDDVYLTPEVDCQYFTAQWYSEDRPGWICDCMYPLPQPLRDLYFNRIISLDQCKQCKCRLPRKGQ